MVQSERICWSMLLFYQRSDTDRCPGRKASLRHKRLLFCIHTPQLALLRHSPWRAGLMRSHPPPLPPPPPPSQLRPPTQNMPIHTQLQFHTAFPLAHAVAHAGATVTHLPAHVHMPLHMPEQRSPICLHTCTCRCTCRSNGHPFARTRAHAPQMCARAHPHAHPPCIPAHHKH